MRYFAVKLRDEITHRFINPMPGMDSYAGLGEVMEKPKDSSHLAQAMKNVQTIKQLF